MYIYERERAGVASYVYAMCWGSSHPQTLYVILNPHNPYTYIHPIDMSARWVTIVLCQLKQYAKPYVF